MPRSSHSTCRNRRHDSSDDVRSSSNRSRRTEAATASVSITLAELRDEFGFLRISGQSFTLANNQPSSLSGNPT